MSHLGDAFGLALRDAARGEPGRYRVERSDGHVDWRVAADYFTDPSEWSAHSVDVLNALTGRILDIGCGAGRHALHLLQRGCEVIGLDSSSGAVSVCRGRGVPAEVGSVGSWDAGTSDSFDAILLMGNNFGLLGSATTAEAHLRWIASRCRPGAMLVGEGLDLAVANQSRAPRHRVMGGRGGSPGEVRLRITYRRWSTAWFPYWLLSPSDLKAAARGSPWRVDSVVGGPCFLATLRLP